MRILLAFRVFFAVLFGLPLPEELRALVAGDEPLALDPGSAAARTAAARAELAAGRDPAPVVAAPVVPAPVVPAPAVPAPVAAPVVPAPVAAPVVPAPVAAPAAPVEDPRRLDAAAIRVLSVLQTEGRLLDFLSEDIDGYGDADVGAAVRDIHKGLRKALKDHFPVEPVRSEDEDASIAVPEGFDPSQLRLVGNVIGKPPFKGKLKHKGWKVTAVHLPRVQSGDAGFVVVPAEVEL